MDTEQCATELNQVLDESDRNLASGWAYWQYKNYKDLTSTSGSRPEGFFNNDGSLQGIKVKALSRTYLKSTQGTIKARKFAHEADTQLKVGQFVADLEIDTSIEAPSVMHAFQQDFANKNNMTWYPNGYEVFFSVAGGQPVPKIVFED